MLALEGKWFRAAERFGGGFIKSFVECWRRADEMNQAILRPVLWKLMEKYPDYLDERMQRTFEDKEEG